MGWSVAGAAAILAGLVAAGVEGGAVDTLNRTWADAVSPDGQFTVKTPCMTAETLFGGPAVSGVRSIPNSLTCALDEYYLNVLTIEPADFPATGPALFDVLLKEEAEADADASEQSTSVRDGRRYWQRRQKRDGAVSLVGHVEISRTRVLWLTASFRDNAKVSVADQNAAVDRFFSSFKVIGK